MEKHPTHCCSLSILSLQNSDTIEDIQRAISILKKQAKLRPNFYSENQRIPNGEKSCLTVISPHEAGANNPEKLEYKLIKCGFRMIVDSFPRRDGYPEGSLRMYFLNFIQ